MAFRGLPFAQLEPFENTARLFLFVNEAGWRPQIEPAKVREPGDRDNYRCWDGTEHKPARHRRALGIGQHVGVNDKRHDEKRP